MPVNPKWLAIFLSSIFLFLGQAIAATSQCKKDLSSVDAGISKQYGEDRTWWNILACPVCLGSELRKDAIVNKSQIREISSIRNIAYLQMSRGDERMCVDTLKPAKRMLRLG
jgi:hypothetical protein